MIRNVLLSNERNFISLLSFIHLLYLFSETYGLQDNFKSHFWKLAYYEKVIVTKPGCLIPCVHIGRLYNQRLPYRLWAWEPHSGMWNSILFLLFYKIYDGVIQECSGAGTRGNGVPTPFSRFALKWTWSCFKMAIFVMRSHTFFVSTTSLVLSMRMILFCVFFQNIYI